MTNSAEQIQSTVTARKVLNEDRLNALPRHFSRLTGHVETMVYVYMAPRGYEDLRLVVAGNYFEETVSRDAAGIVACLFAYSYLSNSTESDAIIVYYHALMDYAQGHPETGKIRTAIN